MSIDPEMIGKMGQVLANLLGPFLNRSSRHASAPEEPPAQITMPRDIAYKLLVQMYKPQGDVTHRSFHVGMGLGAALGVMGAQIISEDLTFMMGNLMKMGFNRRESSPQIDVAEMLRGAGCAPRQDVWPPGDPIADFQMPPGSQYFPEG